MPRCFGGRARWLLRAGGAFVHRSLARGCVPACRGGPIPSRISRGGSAAGSAIACKQGADFALGREPVLDHVDVRVEHRGHANPGLVPPLEAPVRCARLAGLGRLADAAARLEEALAGAVKQSLLYEELLILRARADLAEAAGRRPARSF